MKPPSPILGSALKKGGEVYAPGADLESLALEDGATLDVFKLTAGG